MKTVLVIGKGDVVLSVIHALAKVGVQSVFLSDDARDPACFSRYISSAVRIPFPESERKLLKFLLETRRPWDGSLIIPCNDIYVQFISRNKKSLATRYVTAVPDIDVIDVILNKQSQYRQAAKVGVAIPDSFFPETPADLRKILDKLLYPCLLKPFESHLFYEIYQQKLMVVQNESELIAQFADIHAHKLGVMVSEIIPGPDSHLYSYWSYTNANGDVLAEMCSQKLRQIPAGFGVGTVVKTVPIIEELKKMTQLLLSSFSCTGFANAEFKYDPRDHRFKLMEINGRACLPERITFEAGINFPHITYLHKVEHTSEHPYRGYVKGFYWIHNFHEVTRLLYHRDLRLRDFLRPYREKYVLCIPLRDDPFPFIVKFYRYFLCSAWEKLRKHWNTMV